MMKLSKIALGLFLFASLFAPALAQASPAERQAAIAAFISERVDPEGPGLSMFVQQGGEALFRAGYGLANIEHRVPATPDTVYRIGSITKQFTAAAIMLLVERELLSLDDEITKFIPDYPVHGYSITVRHLLNHTSGIKSYTGVPGWFEGKIREDLTPIELIDAFKGYPMDFGPGDRYQYNNSAYVILGAIIEKVSGVPYAEFIQQNISDALALEHTGYETRDIVPNMATGYTKEEGVVKRANYLGPTQPYAAGMLISTVDDLAKWTMALAGGELVSGESYQQMIAPTRLDDGSDHPYGFGLSLTDVRGQTAIAHSGGINGGQSYAVHIPDADLVVVALSNEDSFTPHLDFLAKKAAAIALGDPYGEPQAVELSRQQRKSIVGKYSSPAMGEMELVLDGNDLTAKSPFGILEFIPTANKTLTVKDSFFYFELQKDADGNEVLNFFPDAGQPSIPFEKQQ